MTLSPAAADTTRGRAARWLRFGIGGLLNTLFSYGLYWLLARMLPYQAAYLLAYASGVVFSYFINAVIVFRTVPSWRGLMVYPGVYVVQYGVSAVLLAVLVEVAGINSTWAPLAVTVVMIPLTYVLSRIALLGGARGHSDAGDGGKHTGKAS